MQLAKLVGFLEGDGQLATADQCEQNPKWVDYRCFTGCST